MADLFISYSREDKARADQVARGMQDAGFDVFWDTEIPPGQTWADYIEEKLSNSAAVIVLWSQHSTKSQWVREEARMGRERGKLIPATLDDSQPPFGFGEVQAANLSTWQGQPTHPDWERLVSAVRGASERAGNPRPAPPPRPTTAQPNYAAASAPAEKKKGVHPLMIIGGLAVAAVVALGVIGATMNDQPATPVNPVVGGQPSQPMAVASDPNAPQGGGPTYREQIEGRLSIVAQALGSQGFRAMDEPRFGQLRRGETTVIPTQLVAGVEYRVVGVCDNDCPDLDLRLRDGAGNVLVEDSATDPMPVLQVPPHGGGQYTVETTMFACNVEPCYYAVVLWGR